MLTLLADLSAAGAVCLGVSAAGVVALPALLLADTDVDLRPLLRRAVESGRLDPLLIRIGPAHYSARLAARHTAVSAAALLMLFTAPEATR